MNFGRLFLYLALLSMGAPAWSAEFCISAGDVASLSSALVSAATNGEDNFIYLEPGLYELSPVTPNLSYYASTSNNLTIEGGYTPFFGGGCGKLIQYAAEATVIDGADGNHDGIAVWLASNGGGLITLKFLEIQNTLSTNPGQSPVVLGDLNNGNINIDLENVIFEGNMASHYYPIDIGTNQIIIRNSVFARNQEFGGYEQIHIDAAKSGGFCAAILNSTVTGNTGGNYALRLDAAPDCIPLIANSIFWGNSSGDLFISISNQSSVSLANDDIVNFGTDPGTTVNGLESVVAVDPLFVDAASGDYSLRDASLLRDLGASLAFLGGPGPLDVLALPRTYGTNPDIGAYELQDVIFANGLDQSIQ